MKYLVGLLLFGILAIIQSTVVSRMPLLKGTADLILVFMLAWALQERVDTAWQWCLIGGLVVSLYTALPLGSLVIAYLACVGIARLLRRRIWKAPFLAMLTATFVGTVVVFLVSMIARLAEGISLPYVSLLNLILLPSLLLNLILAVPVYSIMHDMAAWIYPEELEV